MADPVSDEAFARAVNQMGAATLEHIEAAKAAQAEEAQKGVLISLADLLIRQGVITPTLRETIEKKLQAQQQGGVKQLGSYKLLKKLGEGGMGAVYLAEDTAMLRKVALKVLPKKYASDPEFLTRFRREAKLAGKLNHVNIISAFTVGEELGNHFYVMEFCEGEPLDKLLKREQVLSWEKAIEIVTQVARGLKHAHEHGIIHRDIKPANIFIASGAASTMGKGSLNGVAKILDMGLSKDIGGTEQSFNTQTGMALGTPHYISPEQAKGERTVDGRTDIYSLGATLYQLITGQTPFHGSTAAMIIMKHLSEQLPNPKDVRDDIPDGVVQVIQKMMAKEPADRYADCAELLADLELVIDGKSPSSLAIDVGKSSIAMPQAQKDAAVAAADHIRAARKRATSRHEPVEDPRDADRRGSAQAKPPAKQNKTALYLTGGVAVLVVLLIALTGGRKPDAVRTESPEPQNATPETIPKPEIQNPKLTTPAVSTDSPKPELPKEMSLDLGGGVKMEMVLVPAGEFMMGAEKGGGAEEKPAHKVKISKPFYIGKYEVTVAMFRAFADHTKYQTEAERGAAWSLKGGYGHTVKGVNWRTPGFNQMDNYAACAIAWNDAKEFCKWATQVAQARGLRNAIRLPTEAEWEYACRAGTATRYNTGELKSDLEQAAWFDKNSTNASGQKKPNAWGLYDMHGNVWEWCDDWYGYYAAGEVTDPKGPAAGTERVLRGGGWYWGDWHCRSSNRRACKPDYGFDSGGFRVVVDAPVALTLSTSATVDVRIFNGHRYKFFSEVVGWDEAKAKAESMGGHLATITSKEENDWIAQNFLKQVAAERRLWLGGFSSDGMDRKKWAWVTGEPFEFTNWLPGYPHRSGKSGLMDTPAESGKPADSGWGDIDVTGIGLKDRRGGYLVEWEDDGKSAPVASDGAIKLWSTKDSFQQDENTLWLPAEKAVQFRSRAGLFAPVTPARDGILRASVRIEDDRSLGLIRLRTDGDIEKGFCSLVIRADTKSFDLAAREGSDPAGEKFMTLPFPAGFDPKKWNEFELRIVGDEWTVTVNGQMLRTLRNSNKTTPGVPMIRGHGTVSFRDVVFIPLEKPAAKSTAQPAVPTPLQK